MRDPVQYARFSDERSRPFFNLLERIPAHLPFKTIVDLGCGAGELTRAIAEKYPAAQVLGTDYSPQMLAKSGRLRHSRAASSSSSSTSRTTTSLAT